MQNALRPQIHQMHADREVDARLSDAVDTIKFMLARFSSEERELILKQITDFVRPIPVERAGTVLGLIIKMLPKKRAWTIDDLKTEIKEKGLEAQDKEVYNAMGYLTRKGHIRRVGYGRYVVDGVEVVTADNLGGETTRHEDAYRVDDG